MAKLNIREIPKDDEAGRILHDEMTDPYQTKFVLIDEDNTVMPIHYPKYADDIENFEIEDSDIWVCSYPKTGTTWTQEMVWMIANDLDFEGGKIPLEVRFPFLELGTLFDWKLLKEATGSNLPDSVKDTVEYCKNQKHPRFIKTHLPFSLLPQQLRTGAKQPKIIYVMRNPKDVCVSYYHHSRLLQGCRASLEDFSKVFLAEKVMYGSYWKNIFSYWEKRDLPNLLIIQYEDMKKDLPSVIAKVSQFLGKSLTDDQIEKLTEHLSFESMKKNESVNAESYIEHRKQQNLTIGDGSFIRSGTVGKYKEELSAETIKKLNEWSKKNVSGTDFGNQYCEEVC